VQTSPGQVPPIASQYGHSTGVYSGKFVAQHSSKLVPEALWNPWLMHSDRPSVYVTRPHSTAVGDVVGLGLRRKRGEGIWSVSGTHPPRESTGEQKENLRLGRDRRHGRAAEHQNDGGVLHLVSDVLDLLQRLISQSPRNSLLDGYSR